MSVPHSVGSLAAAGIGVTLSPNATRPEARDPTPSGAMREALLATITLAPASGSAPGAAPDSERITACAIGLRAKAGQK